MKFVEPIRDLDNVNAVSHYIKERYGEKYFIMFEIGIHTGLRISDILRLRVKDVRGKDEMILAEKKTARRKQRNKERAVYFNSRLSAEIREYTKGLDLYAYVVHRANNDYKPVSREYCYRIIRDACEHCGIEHAGTHTMRKTFGYHHYQRTKDVAFLMKLFNHSSPEITLRYIGVNREAIREAMTFNLFG